MSVTVDDLRHFHEQGFLILRQAVARERVDAALRAINHHLGSEGLNPADLPTFRSRSYCPDIRSDAVFRDLIATSTVPGVMGTMMGPNQLAAIKGSQIALRFPLAPGVEPGPPNGHLDGFGSGLNGSAVGTFERTFSALAVVLLSPLPAPYMGNFTVWPGTHHAFERHYQTTGLADVGPRGRPTLSELPEPCQMIGEPGDIVITHHLLMHTAAPNASPHIRYAAIFRLQHIDVVANGQEVLIDIWREWPGIRQACLPNA